LPVCKICNRDFGIINNNHLKTHGTTLDEYIKQYGDPNAGVTFLTTRTKTTPKAIKEKVEKPKKALSYQAVRTIDELYNLDDTITIPSNFIRIGKSNLFEFDRMLELIERYKEIDIDTETTGLDPFEDIISDIIITIHEPAFSYNYHIPMLHVKSAYQNFTNEQFMCLFRDGSLFDEAQSLVYSLDNVLESDQLSREWVFARLKPILEDPSIKKNLFNDYFDEMMLWGDLGINLAGVQWDGLIAAHILNENEQSHKLKDLYKKYLHEKEYNPDIRALGVDTYEEQFGKIKFFRVPMNVATAYAAKDGYMTGRLKDFQKPYIDSIGRLDEIYYNIEMPLLPILIEMRKEGIGVDLEFAHDLEVEMKEERLKNENRLYELLGNINLNSPKQLSHALFDVMKLPNPQGGSTKAEVLQELADDGYEVADILLDYKKSEKLISTYLEGLDKIVCKKTGRVHCRFNQNGASTGRFSSSKPNLQNIPAKNKKIRKIFKARQGYVLISADYSQIEPRLLAHIANDGNMIQAYQEGRDIYSSMAAFVFTLLARAFAERLTVNLAVEEDLVHYASPVYKELLEKKFVYSEKPGLWTYREVTIEDCYDGSLFRKIMKTLLLGMMYSMSEKGLAARLKISEEDALEIMNYFFKAFPDIKKAMNYYKVFCKANGYVETMFGRKRRLPEIYSEEWWVRKKAERQVLNSVIQGTAADIMKIAMIKVGQDQRIKDLGGKLLLTVHDELILEAPKETAVQVTKYVIDDMVGVCNLKVPMKVDGEIFVDGRWYGESISVKNKSGWWGIFQDYDETDSDGNKVHKTRELNETEIPWCV
jgi:DNA polymerase-1